jgi:hypothetical protein
MADEFYFADDYINVDLKGSKYQINFRNMPVGKEPKSIVVVMCTDKPCPRTKLFSVRAFKGDEYITIGSDIKSGDYIVEFGSRPADKEARSVSLNLTRE